MLLKDYFAANLSPNDFVQQTNIIGCCDYIYYSSFFVQGNFAHFGINGIEECISEPPEESCIIMCRFKDGEIYRLLEQCSHRSHYNYIIVQTLIGDDGFIDQSFFNFIPENVKYIF